MVDKIKQTTDLNALSEWLKTLKIGVEPSIKVNGKDHPTAIVTVDIGQPLKQIRLTSEQSTELGHRLKLAALEVLGREAPIRVQIDNNYGIHWAGLSA